jgi:hypothetical protein
MYSYFSSVINLTIPGYVSFCVFSCAVGCLPIRIIKNTLTPFSFVVKDPAADATDAPQP